MKTEIDPVVIVALPGGGAAAFTLAAVEEGRRRAAELGFNPALTATAPIDGVEQLVNSHKMAELLGVHDTTAEAMAHRGEIPCIRVGKALRFEPRAVLAVLRATGL